MSVLEQLKKAGLDVELESLITDKLESSDDEATKESLVRIIDEVGLKAPKTMKQVGLLQREGKLKIGLYKELVALNQRLEDAESGATQQQPAPAVSQPASPVMPASVETPMADATVEVAEKLTDKEEQKIRDKMKKEEEKIRARLAAREGKIRDRLKARAEKKATRQGMKLENVQKIKENKDKIKALRNEVKDKRAAMKVLSEEVKALRPKRDKKEKAPKAEAKAAK